MIEEMMEDGEKMIDIKYVQNVLFRKKMKANSAIFRIQSFKNVFNTFNVQFVYIECVILRFNFSNFIILIPLNFNLKVRENKKYVLEHFLNLRSLWVWWRTF